MSEIAGFIEVFRPAPKKAPKVWRFRFRKAGAIEAMFVSENTFDTPERAEEVAVKVNNEMFCGAYQVA
jgi:hypothetical protein